MIRLFCHGRVMILTLLLLACLPFECGARESFTCTTKTRENRGAKWVFSYTYPEIAAPGELMGARGNVKDFNIRVKSDVDREEKSFMEALKKNERPAGAPDITDEHRVVYTPVGLTSHYCSFMFEHYEMITGMAHPSSWYTTVTWTGDGKFLAVSDLFKVEKEGLERLSEESLKLLKEKFRGGDSDERRLESGLAPKAENFQYFCHSPTGLHVYFNYYQLGPGPLGAPAITIPWKALDDVLSPAVKDMIGKGKR